MNDPRDPRNPSDLIPGGGDHSQPNDVGGEHQVIHDRNRRQHISWDTDRQGDYVPGSGHTRDDQGHTTISDWDRH